MHLADFDEQLVASRIWTDTGHIEQRLADLTKHMENVIQVYLRKEFHSIEEYNAFAGEMAEPYRVLVVANFPANFSEAAVHRIKSIVASGARCGVFVLMSVDTKRAPAAQLPIGRPRGRGDRAALGGRAFRLGAPRFRAGGRRVRHAAAGRALQGDRPRGRRRGQGTPAASRCPSPASSRRKTSGGPPTAAAGIDVPLGRAGAMKLQHLDLGHGTSQHVLISGKTGSGKSTLLHVLITNLALRYSPDEVELYLVDFKKGVEFKAYARVAAAARAGGGDRERAGVRPERLAAARRRAAHPRRPVPPAGGRRTSRATARPSPTARLPRILLIIDEFQELFVEDDRIAQESAPAVGPAGAAGPGVRHPRAAGLADARRGLYAWPAARSARWPCASPCSAARPTPT